MQKTLLLSLIGISTILSGLYILNQKVGDYEDYIVFDGDTCTWDLSNQKITDTSLESISSYIKNNLYQDANVQIRTFILNLSDNQISQPNGLFQAIQSSQLAYGLSNLQVDLSYNKVNDLEFFYDFTAPYYARGFSLKLNQNEQNVNNGYTIRSVSGLAQCIKSMTVDQLNIELNYNYITDMETLLDAISENSSNRSILYTLSLDFGNNPENFKSFSDSLTTTLVSKEDVEYLTLGLENLGVSQEYLSKLQESLLNMNSLKTLDINISNNGFSTTEIENSFSEITEKLGENNVVIIN